MHILIGAGVGAVFAVGISVVFSLVTKKKITAKNLLIAAVGGAVAGGVGAATLGASGLVGTSLARQAGAFTLGGATGGAAERVTHNAAEGKPLHEKLVTSTAIGAGAGLVSLGTLKGSRAVLERVAPNLAKEGSGLVSRMVNAKVPGTGAGALPLIENRVAASLAPSLHPVDPILGGAEAEDPPTETDSTQAAPRAPPETNQARGLRGAFDR